MEEVLDVLNEEAIVGDSDIRCERLAVASRYQCGSAGFSISTTYVFTDSSRICANPLVPW